MGKIKIYSSFEQNAVFFDGSTVSPKFIGVPVAQLHPTESDRIIIKRNDRVESGTTEFRKIFKRLKINRIQNQDGVDLVSGLGYDRTAVLSYLNAQFNKTFADVASDATAEYDIYVSIDYTEGISDGTRFRPFTDIQSAIDAANDGDSIFIKGGTYNITSKLVIPTSKGLNLFGDYNTVIQYASYIETNEDVLEYIGDGTKSMSVHRITFKHAGEYGIQAVKLVKYEMRNCTFVNNGWNGTEVNTVLPSTTSGILGYDSSNTDLQSFYAGANASNGGAVRIEEVTNLEIIANTFNNNLRGLRVQDCGVNGYGFITRNVSSQNIESGIYLAAGTTYYGCQNITVMMNSSSYNANNGVLVVGGLNNKVASCEIFGNWNAGVADWASGNFSVRDCGIYNNNRSQYNGIGNTGDAKSSVFIGEAYNLLGTVININPNARFIAEVLDNQIQYTGLGSNTEKVGVYLDESLGSLASNSKNLIRIDNVGFVEQDYAIDMSACDISNLEVVIGNNTYYNIQEKAIKPPLAGDYYELPFSNFSTSLKEVDVSVSNTGNIILKEGVGGVVLNPYMVNELVVEASGSDLKFKLKGTPKIQFTVPVSGTSINGSMVNSVQSLAITQLNDVLTNTIGYQSTDNFVSAFNLSGDNLTLTLQDGTSYTVDVTTLGIDENKFVSSGALNGSNLELTMNDSSVVVINASNMINSSTLPAISNDWYISYGNRAGELVAYPSVVADVENQQPFYNADFLYKGEEYVWTHNVNGFYYLGIYSGAEDNFDEGEIILNAKWSNNFKFINTVVSETSLAVDVSSRYASGYTIDNNTVFSLRYGNDNYLYLYDISNPIPVLVGKSNSVLVGDYQVISMGGQNQPNAKFPVMIKRTDTWDIVADFDNSENNEWSDGIEAQTIVKSNLELESGYKMVFQLPSVGGNRSYGINYTGASTGEANPINFMTARFRWDAQEIIAQAADWTLNTSNSLYDDVSFGQPYWNVTDGNAVTVSYRYLEDNTLELWDEDRQELIMTYNNSLDGNSFSLYYGATSYPSTELQLPNVSIQLLNQGSQPVTSFAPDISNQSFDITEGLAFNVQIALDSGSDIVNQYVELDAPSWAVLNQETGLFMGTAPAFGADNEYIINCKAANAVGGHTNFTITLNVIEPVYTNTKSLRFEDGVSSYIGGNAALVTALERSGTGDGSSDAWTIAFWFKGSTSNTGQTLFYFGAADVVNSGYIEIKQTNHNGQKRLRFRYGSNVNHIQMTTPSGSIDPSIWQHVLVSYNGGTTGVASGSLSNYYSRFKIFIDGVEQTTANTHNNNGYNGTIVGQNYRFGRFSSGNYPKDVLLNQLAIWNSDQSSNVVGLYNGGDTQEISSLSAGVGSMNTNYLPVAHYYEIEDSVSTIEDLVGTAHFVGYNFNSGDLVTDAP